MPTTPILANAFVETVAAKHVENVIRTVGGLMYLGGALVMVYNVWRTIRMPRVASAQADGTPAALLQAVA